MEIISDAVTEQLPIWVYDGRKLQVNEIFYSIEGEGLRVGEPTTFVRMAKCNLRCFFCDTEFDAFETMNVEEIVAEVQRHSAEWVCLTGGEPLGQNLLPLCSALTQAGYRLHIETNGTLPPQRELYDHIDHWTVSPKRRAIDDQLTRITELKYVVGKMFNEELVEEDRADYVYLQPESSEPRYTHKALEILTRHPKWRLSGRVHKSLGLP